MVWRIGSTLSECREVLYGPMTSLSEEASFSNHADILSVLLALFLTLLNFDFVI